MRIITCICSMLFGLTLMAQPGLPEDPEAIQWIRQGKTYLEAREYDLALSAFEQGLMRPLNQATSAALYFTGLSHYYQNDWEAAMDRFSSLARQYPDSRYLPEALYHRSLMLIQSDQTRRQRKGIEDLFFLSRQADSSLAPVALNAARKFLFYQASPTLLRQVNKKANLQEQLIILQAQCYRLVEDNNRPLARLRYEAYLDAGNSPDFFIERLLDEDRMTKYVEDDIVKIAVFLPLHLDTSFVYFPDYISDSLSSDSIQPIPRKSRLALSFYQGFHLALEQYLPFARKRFYVQVFDTHRDSALTQAKLSELDSLRPDIVIGEIYNKQSEILATWCERNATPLIIPLSPTTDLVENRSFVFLAHPSAMGHGAYMAQYARKQLGLRRIALWTDQRQQTELLAQSFQLEFDTLGGEIVRIPVDSIFDDSTRLEINQFIRSLSFQQIDGIYLPIQANQELAGYILSQIQLQNLNVRVLGGPHWYQKYKNIDRQLKDNYEVLFSTSYMADKEDPEYSNFFQAYLQAYQFPPNPYNIHGYDLGLYLIQTLDSYHYYMGKTLSSFMRESPSYQGIHISYHFQNKQQNQFVNIGAYRDGKIIKVNAPSRIDLDQLFPSEE